MQTIIIGNRFQQGSCTIGHLVSQYLGHGSLNEPKNQTAKCLTYPQSFINIEATVQELSRL